MGKRSLVVSVGLVVALLGLIAVIYRARPGVERATLFEGLIAIPRAKIAGPIDWTTSSDDVESGLQDAEESSHHRDRDDAAIKTLLHTSSQTETSPNSTSVTVTQSSVIATVPSSQGNALLNVSSSLPPLPSWKPGSFCDDFIEHTLQQPIPMCGPKISSEDSIKCFRSNYESTVGVKCYIHNLVNFPRTKLGSWGPLTLLEDPYHCPNPTNAESDTKKHFHYMTNVIKAVTESKLKPVSEKSTICDEWINEPTYFLQSDSVHVHIYFRFIVYYNLHQAILDDGASRGEFVVVRLRNDSSYLFPEFEKALFPELVRFIDLPNVTLCFKKAILVPYTFCSLLFQCKMGTSVRSRCSNCNGKGLYGTSLFSFRARVLKACSLVDLSPEEWKNKPKKNIVVVLRRPYQRWKKDKPSNFQRVLTNANELVGSLKKAFPTVNVSAVYMESIPICDQIRYAHSADVLIGVHGAGLVHLWWLQEQGLLLELNPSFELANPTFKLLSTLSGRKYYSMTISGGMMTVSVNVNEVVRKLKSIATLT